MENIKKSYKNNKFKISTPTWNEEFELPDGSYSIPDIQIYFEYIFKKYGEKTVNPSHWKYTNKIENRVTFRIKRGYHLDLLTPEAKKLLGSTKSKTIKYKNCENVPYLEITEVVLIHCNVFNNRYQQNWRVLYTFVPNKSLGQLLDISKIISKDIFKANLIQNVRILKYRLLIKTSRDRRQNQYHFNYWLKYNI